MSEAAIRRYAILTLSDKASIGEREDTSAPALQQRMHDAGWACAHYLVIPDDRARIETELVRLCDDPAVAVVLTTGGTGFTDRDVTPEATLAVSERMAPGIAEAMRMRSLAITPMAMLSRAVAAIRNRTLIVNLPGSRKGALECLDVVLPVLAHAVELLRGVNTEHGST
ncbi:MAG: MogA/MoaB family molybdenum cofactor biosynthesis protein [Deltaproteobacteria bacterium]|nr:MogA/MoaB family molybdenum cofactor biosynthesis protein [Deltaproteobacteria bacterium]